MALEIERKYLINKDLLDLSNTKGVSIKQGFIINSIENVVRVRLKGEKAFLTLKSRQHSFTRTEFEYEIPVKDALELFDQMIVDVIDKTRYKIKFEGHIWEVDVFYGKNTGLIIAEIELKFEEEQFEKPDWLGKEVTFDMRYYNSNLVKHPYSVWKDQVEIEIGN